MRLQIAWAGLILCAVGMPLSAETFQEFKKREGQELREFAEGKPQVVARVAGQRAEPSPERLKALALYNRYCQLRGSLEDPDPKKGYYVRIKQLDAKLFPTGRPYVDSYSLWGNREWDYEWPLLQALRARVPKIEAEMAGVEAQWKEAGFGSKIGPLSDHCYGRKTWVVWLDKESNLFPSPMRSNQMDYVGVRIDEIWPTNAPSATVSGSDQTGKPPHVHETKPEIPTPPEVGECDTSTNNIPKKKSWAEMTADERHEALKANDPDAWINVYRALVSGQTNAIEEVKDALGASGKTAGPHPVSLTDIKPVAVSAGKPWKDMTPEEQHEALKRSDPAAWDAVRDALLSGDPKRVASVVKALGARTIPESAIQIAYWHGYQLGLQEKVVKPESSQLETVAEAYKQPELMKAVRQGYADAMAGNPSAYGGALPVPSALGAAPDVPPSQSAGPGQGTPPPATKSTRP